MRKLFIGFYLLTVGCFAQKSWFYHTAYGVSYGNFRPVQKKFRNSFERISNEKLDRAVVLIGVNMSIPYYAGNNSGGALEMGLCYFMMQRLTGSEGEKIDWFGNNFYVGAKYGLVKIPKRFNFSFGINGIVGSQRTIIQQETNSEIYRNWNLSISPLAEIMIRPLRFFFIAITYNFQYDISDTVWRNHFNSFSLIPSSFTGHQVKITIAGCKR
jgi:hypothetical protein